MLVYNIPHYVLKNKIKIKHILTLLTYATLHYLLANLVYLQYITYLQYIAYHSQYITLSTYNTLHYLLTFLRIDHFSKKVLRLFDITAMYLSISIFSSTKLMKSTNWTLTVFCRPAQLKFKCRLDDIIPDFITQHSDRLQAVFISPI